MNFKVAISASLAGFLCAGAFAQTYAPNRIIVRTRNGVIPPLARMAMKATETRFMPDLGISILTIGAGTVEDGIAILRRSHNVIYAEKDQKAELFHVPNDPLYTQQYGHQQVKGEAAWDIFKGNPKMVVAVLDTGLIMNHEDIVGRIAPGGFDYSDNDSDPSDSDGHGSHCGGIVAANTNNAIGVASSAYNARLLPLKVFPNSFATTVAAGIRGAADKGAKILSLSLGFPFESQVMQDAINYAWGKGCLVIAAAGNAGNTVKNYPAAAQNVIAVAATNSSDTRAGFSTFGDWVHVAAPGEDIMSFGISSNSSYVKNSGTSMACPFVASVAALVWGRNPALTNAQVRDIIFSTCDNVGPFVIKGRVNAHKAILKAVPLTEYSSTSLLSKLGVVGGVTEGTNVNPFSSDFAAAASTNATDAGRYTIRSKFINRLGGVASLDTIVRVTTPLSAIKNARVELVSNAPAPASTFIYAYNYSTASFDQVGLVGNSGVEKTSSVAMDVTTLGRYMNSSGHIRFLVRSISPVRAGQNPWNISFNRISVTGGYDSTLIP